MPVRFTNAAVATCAALLLTTCGGGGGGASIAPYWLRAGIVVAGMLGGIISSTSVTLRFARDSRSPALPGSALAGGVIGACTVMLVRVAVACAVLNPALALAALRYIWPALVVGIVALVALSRMHATTAAANHAAVIESPLQLGTALQMTALFQIVLFLILAVQAHLGPGALTGTSALVGLTDLDALTLSLARSATTDAQVSAATAALIAGILSNTTLKLLVALLVGRGGFRVATPMVLAGMALVILGALAAQ